MKEIDEMDILGFLQVRAWNAKKNHRKKEPPPGFIDNVWPGLKP